MPTERWIRERIKGLSYALGGLAADTNYYFRVQARNSAGLGPLSSTVMLTTPFEELPPPQSGSLRDVLEANALLIVCVGLVFLIVVLVVLLVAYSLNRTSNGEKRQATTTLQTSPPNDLWVHHDPLLELKPMADEAGKQHQSNDGVSCSAAVSPLDVGFAGNGVYGGSMFGRASASPPASLLAIRNGGGNTPGHGGAQSLLAQRMHDRIEITHGTLRRSRNAGELKYINLFFCFPL